MLTRIRVESEDSTIQGCQNDLMAVYDRLVTHVDTGPVIYGEEIYTSLPQTIEGRRYNGRVVIVFPVDGSHFVRGVDTHPMTEQQAVDAFRARAEALNGADAIGVEVRVTRPE